MNLIGFCKCSSSSLQDNSPPWLPVDTSRENMDFTLDTPPKCLNLNTPSQNMLKKTRTNTEELKRKSALDKQFNLKLSNIYSNKLSKFKLEKQLNTIRKRKHANHTNNNIVKKPLDKNTNSQSNSNLGDKYENTTAQKLAAQQKKTEEGNKNGIKHRWSRGTCVVIGDSMVAGIDEHKMTSKRLIKVRSFPRATSSDMYHYFVPILESKPDHVMLHVGTNDVDHYKGTEIVDKLLELKAFIAEQLPTTHVVISHPITRADLKHLAMKVGDIQSHLRKLQIDMIENGNINSNHLNGRGLHLNSEGILQFAKNLIERIRRL